MSHRASVRSLTLSGRNLRLPEDNQWSAFGNSKIVYVLCVVFVCGCVCRCVFVFVGSGCLVVAEADSKLVLRELELVGGVGAGVA